MGETTADTRHEIERTRAELGDTLTALRSRTVVVGGKVIRVAIIAGGALAAAGSTAAVVVIARWICRPRRATSPGGDPRRRTARRQGLGTVDEQAGGARAPAARAVG
jgi:hypothetical protein